MQASSLRLARVGVGILDLFSLQDKVVVVTGGAGRHAPQIIRALAEAGAAVYGADINAEAMCAVAENLCGEGLQVCSVQVDQRDEHSILALRQEVLQRSKRLDVLVNAAIYRPMQGWQDDAARFAESMQVNATGLFLVTRTLGEVMAQQRSGSIINIASIQGMVGPDKSLYENLDFHGFIPDYFFQKGGMINFTRFVASYYGQYNVRCNCVSPGGIQADDLAGEFVRRYSHRTMLGRMARTSDLTGLIVFLASDASSYITGANIPVDGGYTAK